MDFFESKAKKNAKRLMETCNAFIDKYESNSCGVPSAKDDIDAVLMKQLDAAKQELDRWDNTVDYVRVAHTLLANITFDLLSSGRYHIYAGTLNPMSCAKNLMTIYEKSMEYGKSRGEVTEEEIKQQHDMLMDNISEVG